MKKIFLMLLLAGFVIGGGLMGCGSVTTKAPDKKPDETKDAVKDAKKDAAK